MVTNALLTRGVWCCLIVIITNQPPRRARLIQAGATPVYREAARNPFVIGGVMRTVLMKRYLRDQIRDVMRKAPMRCVALWRSFGGTYDDAIGARPGGGG